jgi:phospholipid/cholesterol/gamma-HCH transport system substrate-binding protein
MSAKKEIQVGLTVLISMAILVAGLLWFKQVQLSGDVQTYQVRFDTVGGLKTHDRVQVLGIRRGAVSGFEQEDNSVLVTIAMDPGVVLREDATIKLTTLGIVGEKLMDIDPGRGAVAPEGFIFKGKADADMAELTAAGAEALDDVKQINVELTALLKELRREGRIDSTLNSTRVTMDNLRDTSTELGPKLVTLTSDLQKTVNALNLALAGPDSNLAKTLAGTSHMAARADSLMTMMAQATLALVSIVESLERGEGSAGMLLRDDTLHAQAESTIIMMQDLIADVKERPKRYFNFSLF